MINEPVGNIIVRIKSWRLYIHNLISLKSRFVNLTAIILTLFLLSIIEIYAQENCFDGIDNDFDELVDLNDSDCYCNTNVEINLISNPSFEEEDCPPDFASIHCAPGWSKFGLGTPDFLEIGNPWWNFAEGPYEGTNYVGSITGIHSVIEIPVSEMFANCLVEPLIAGQTYDLSFKIGTIWSNNEASHLEFPYNFSPNHIDFEVIGIVECIEDDTYYDIYTCLSEAEYAGPEFEILVEYEYVPIEETWTDVNIQITPTQDTYGLIFGTLCQSETLPVAIGDEEDMRFYNFYDDFSIIVETSNEVEASITSQGSWCGISYELLGEFPFGSQDLQWFYNGVAIQEENSGYLDLQNLELGGGFYQLYGLFGDQCFIVDYEVEAIINTLEISADEYVVCGSETITFDWITNADSVQVVEWNIGNTIFSEENVPTIFFDEPGEYDVQLTVVDNQGCEWDYEFANAVVVSSIPIVTIVPSNLSPCLDETITFELNIISGETSVFAWDFGNGENSTEEGPHDIIYSESGEYAVTLSASNSVGCISPMDTMEFEFLDVPLVDISTYSACVPGMVESVIISDMSNISEATWMLDDIEISSEPNFSETIVDAGSFEFSFLTVDNYGCLSQQSFPFQSVDTTNFVLHVFPLIGCSPLSIDGEVMVLGENLVDDCLWNLNNNNLSDQCLWTKTISSVGDHDLSFNGMIGNCSFTLSETIKVYELPEIQVRNQIFELDDFLVKLALEGSSNHNIVDWNWDMQIGDFTETYSEQNINVLVPTADGSKSIISDLTGIDENGCVGRNHNEFNIDNFVNVYVPTSFSPNSDGLNDLWRWETNNVEEIEVKVYDRFGRLAFHSQEIEDGWTGKHRDATDYGQFGIYYYVISYKPTNSVWQDPLIGHITIVR